MTNSETNDVVLPDSEVEDPSKALHEVRQILWADFMADERRKPGFGPEIMSTTSMVRAIIQDRDAWKGLAESAQRRVGILRQYEEDERHPPR